MFYKQLTKLSILFLIILNFNACTNKSKNILSKNNLYQNGLEYTKIKDLVHSLETKAILNVTYLNVSNPKKYDNEDKNKFLIGVYIVNDSSNEEEKQGLNNKRYTLSLNSNLNYEKKLIKKDDELYELIPMKNPYAKYYLVEFKKTKDKTLSIKYIHNIYGAINISFKNF